MIEDDKLFRDRLFNMEASYPDDMWDRISSDLPKKRRRGGIWFFLLLAFLMTGLFSGILIPSLGDDGLTESKVEETMHSSQKRTAHYQEAISPVTASTIEEKKSEAEAFINNDAFITSISLNPATGSSGYMKDEKEIKSGESYIKKINNDNHHLSSSANHSDTSGYVRITSDNEEISSASDKEKVSEINVRNHLDTPLNIEPVGISISYDIPEFEQPECPSFGFDRESGIFFDLLYSHDLPQRSLTSKSQELSDYVNSRNNTESTLYSFSASLRVAYISESGLGFKTGLNYSQINERFEYLDPDASLIRTIITIDTLIVGGVSTVVSDTSTIRIPGSLDITTYNRYRFFDIPFLATYEAPINDKLSYSLNGGVLLNLAFNQKGRFLDPSDMPVWFSEGEPDRLDAFRSSAGLSLFGSIGLHYSLNDHLDIILEPNFRLYAGSLTTEVYPLDQKWLTIGLSHGIRYKF